MSKREKATKQAKATVPVAEVPVRLTVNGEIYELMVKPNWTLQYVLHDKLGFTSVKDMCAGRGACGSCVTIVDK